VSVQLGSYLGDDAGVALVNYRHRVMNTVRRSIRFVAIATTLLALIYWLSRAAHITLNVGPVAFLLDNAWLYMLFVLPGTLMVAALAWTHLSAIRIGAIVSNVLGSICWIAYALATPTLGLYTLFPSAMALTHVLAVVSLMLTANSGRQVST
jgi:hypothetical protein